MGLLSNPVGLVDLYCYKPPEELKLDLQKSVEIWREAKVYSEEALTFMTRIAEKSGLSPTETHLPKSLNPRHSGPTPNISIDSSMDEARMCLCGAVDGLLKKTGLRASDVDILVTCCSIFCPTPSMSAMIVNEFKMKPCIQAYHLGGMGCSMGVVSVNLIRDLLKAHPNSNAMLVTTETTTPAHYGGKDRSRLVANMLFRMGGSAVLLSNKPSMMSKAKYQLQTSIRIHQGYRNEAYSCIKRSPDDDNVNGLYLGKDVVDEASRGLAKVLTMVAPRVLDIGQMSKYIWTQMLRWWDPKIGVFRPSFDECLDHVLIHAGGAKVLAGIGKELNLSNYMLTPSYSVLWNYGNVSSSSTWYTLANIETMRGVKKGDVVFQVGVGSGVKCGVNLWRAKKDVHEVHQAWEQLWENNGRVKEVRTTKRRPQMFSPRLLMRLAMTLIFVFVAIFLTSQESFPNTAKVMTQMVKHTSL